MDELWVEHLYFSSWGVGVVEKTKILQLLKMEIQIFLVISSLLLGVAFGWS